METIKSHFSQSFDNFRHVRADLHPKTSLLFLHIFLLDILILILMFCDCILTNGANMHTILCYQGDPTPQVANNLRSNILVNIGDH